MLDIYTFFILAGEDNIQVWLYLISNNLYIYLWKNTMNKNIS